MLHQWEQENRQIPSDIRGMMAGTIAVEWTKPKGSIILDRGVIFGQPPWGSDE